MSINHLDDLREAENKQRAFVDQEWKRHWRYEFAKATAQSIYSNNNALESCAVVANKKGIKVEHVVAVMSVDQADALLKELEK